MTYSDSHVAEIEDIENLDLGDLIDKLSKDLRELSKNIDPDAVRFIVRRYYQLQKVRIKFSQNKKALDKQHKPSLLMEWLESQQFRLEKAAAIILDGYSQSQPISGWLRSQKGIGPVISAGLIANFDIEQAPTAGHFWSFAGLDANKKWLPKQKRPWNADLKRLCFLIGESFVKVSNREDAFYGKLYLRRKEYEWKKNLAGDYAEFAITSLSNFEKSIKSQAVMESKGDENTLEESMKEKDKAAREVKKWYQGAYTGIQKVEVEEGDTSGFKAGTTLIRGVPVKNGQKGVRMLSPSHIHARSKRWAVKMFISHLHQVWYETHYKKPIPSIYTFNVLGHPEYHYLPPPGFNSKYKPPVAPKPRTKNPDYGKKYYQV